MINYERFVDAAQQAKNYSPPLKIVKYPGKKATEFSSRLFDIADILDTAAGSGIQCTIEREVTPIGKPSLTLTHPASGVIHYMAVPEQLETDPFIEVITFRVHNKSNLSGDIQASLSTISNPVNIHVYVTSRCPHCPHAVRAANTLALQCKNISVSIIDIEQFPENSKKYSIQSIPVTVIDHRHIINNVVSETVLARHILTRGTEENDKMVFLSQINSGNIDLAFKNIVNNDQNIKHFISAWRNSTLTLRMGLLLLSEQIIDHKKELLYTIVPDLIGILSSDNVPLRGDTVDLLTQIGHKDSIEPIKKLLHDPNPDIAELAKDAIEELKK